MSSLTPAAGGLAYGTNVPVGSNSEVGARDRHVRFPPDSDRTADIAGGPVRANNGSRNRLINLCGNPRIG
jgi:hypothetical protein